MWWEAYPAGIGYGFQFLGIPPKGEPGGPERPQGQSFSSFQFLGIPPKGELFMFRLSHFRITKLFPISRDPPEGGTRMVLGMP